jgi:hypothetical protein
LPGWSVFESRAARGPGDRPGEARMSPLSTGSSRGLPLLGPAVVPRRGGCSTIAVGCTAKHHVMLGLLLVLFSGV